MKILFIGDLHGKSFWPHLIQKYTYMHKRIDKIVFLGDYVDCPYTSNADQLANLKALVEFKKANPDKVTLILGNHDIHYINSKYRCSGYSETKFNLFYPVFKENLKLFQMATGFKTKKGYYLATHAGVTNGWRKDCEAGFSMFYGNQIFDTINFLFLSRYIDDLNKVSAVRGGHDPFSGPLWADKSETQEEEFLPPGIHQIVGHSKVPSVIQYGFKDKGITYCDCLDYSTECFVLKS